MNSNEIPPDLFRQLLSLLYSIALSPPGIRASSIEIVSKEELLEKLDERHVILLSWGMAAP